VKRRNEKSFWKLVGGAIPYLLLPLAFAYAPIENVMAQVPPAQSSGDSKPAEQQTEKPPETQRSRRSQAYLKLLEGQRYYSGIPQGDVENKLKAAKQAFEEAIALDSSLVEAHAVLAEVNFYLEDFDAAAKEAQEAIKLAPDNLGAHRVLSRVYSVKSGLREGQLDAKAAALAVAELKEVVRIDKTNAEGWALLGDFYREQGRFEDAIDAYQHWAATPPSNDAHFFRIFTQGRELSSDAASARLAETFIAAGRGSEAVAAARQALSRNPANKSYGELLGKALQAEGGSDPKVVAELQQLLAQNPANTSLAVTLAQALARTGKVDDAATILKTSIEKRPAGDRDGMMLRLELAQTYADAARFEEGVATYEALLADRKVGETGVLSDDNKRFAGAVLQREVQLQKSAEQPEKAMETIARMRRILGPTDPTADKELVGLLKDQGKRQEALEAAQAGSRKFPAENDFVRLQADALTSLGRVDDAATLMKGRLKGNLNDFTTLLLISTFYMDAGRGSDAVEYAKKALALVPAERTDLSAIALTTLASAQERAGDAAGAEQSLRKVLKEDPKNATVLNNLGYFLVERNERLEEAVDLIQRALKQEPSNASFLDSLGWAYFKQGDLDKAERYLTDAALRSRSSVAIQEHLGELYVKRQQPEKAAAAFRRAKTVAVDKESTDRLNAKIKALGVK
jgi:tetratricopeptide (TPR) repeat protein